MICPPSLFIFPSITKSPSEGRMSRQMPCMRGPPSEGASINNVHTEGGKGSKGAQFQGHMRTKGEGVSNLKTKNFAELLYERPLGETDPFMLTLPFRGRSPPHPPARPSLSRRRPPSIEIRRVRYRSPTPDFRHISISHDHNGHGTSTMVQLGL